MKEQTELGIKKIGASAIQAAKHSDQFVFEHVFDMDKNNMDIFEEMVRPIVQKSTEGYNGTSL